MLRPPAAENDTTSATRWWVLCHQAPFPPRSRRLPKHLRREGSKVPACRGTEEGLRHCCPSLLIPRALHSQNWFLNAEPGPAPDLSAPRSTPRTWARLTLTRAKLSPKRSAGFQLRPSQGLNEDSLESFSSDNTFAPCTH